MEGKLAAGQIIVLARRAVGGELRARAKAPGAPVQREALTASNRERPPASRAHAVTAGTAGGR